MLDADAAALVDDPTVDIVVEAIPGANPATALIERALAQGKTVVTANKAVIAPSGPRLWALAQQHGAGLWFEAAAGGGLPVVALLRDSLRGDNISGICGVINATTNVILTRMRNTGDTLAAALSGAQRRGVAEADPSSDLDGWDATYKLVILSWLAFGAHVAPEDVRRTGIRELDVVDLGYTGQLGYTVKLLASARMAVGAAELEIGVQPTAIPEGHPLFGVDDAANAVIITGDLQAETFVRGAGGEGAVDGKCRRQRRGQRCAQPGQGARTTAAARLRAAVRRRCRGLRIPEAGDGSRPGCEPAHRAST